MSKFIIRVVKSGIKFDLRAGNGEIIAVSEAYSGHGVCLRGIESVKKCAPMAAMEDQITACEKEKCPKFELYADRRGHFRFRLKATNGKIIAVSEGYTTKAACLAGVESVRKNAPTALIEEE